MNKLLANGIPIAITRLAIFVVLAIAGQANAAGVSAYLDQSNENSAFPDGTNYLQVTISDGIDGAIDFRVETLAPLSSIAGSNYGIQSFSFNFGDSGAGLANIAGPDRWRVSGDFNHSGYGSFDAHLSVTGRTRQDPLNFSIIGVSGDVPGDYLTALSLGNASEGNQLFAAHVAAFDGPKRISSAQFGGGMSVVPLPASAWLMLSGVGSLALFSRRRKKSKSDREVASTCPSLGG